MDLNILKKDTFRYCYNVQQIHLNYRLFELHNLFNLHMKGQEAAIDINHFKFFTEKECQLSALIILMVTKANNRCKNYFQQICKIYNNIQQSFSISNIHGDPELDMSVMGVTTSQV